MSTIIPNVFAINGVVDTNKTVLENMNELATTAGAWMTFDSVQGAWAVVINQSGTSVKSFNNSNILSSIAVSSTGLTEMYNAVEAEFPHKDLKDRPDYVKFSIDPSARYPNEIDNVLTMKFNLVNDPIQAQLLAARELKQSRVDKVIEFRTDFSSLGLVAGQLIDVTVDYLGYTNKVFRIIKIQEVDEQDGIFQLSITALEYDADVYSTAGLIREERNQITEIPRKEANEEIQVKEDISTGSQLLRLLGTTLVTNLLNSAFSKNPLTGKVTQILSPKDATVESNLITAATGDKGVATQARKKPGVIITGADSICEGSTLTLTLECDCLPCMYEPMPYNYTITGVQAADITPFPLTGTVTVPGTMSIPIATDADTGTETLLLSIGGSTKSISIFNQLTFTYVTTASPTSVTEGGSSTVTLTTTGVSNGTSVPYVISGAGTARVSTPLTGTVTVNSNSATLTVATIDDGIYTGDQTVTVTFNAAQADPCGQLDKTAAINILDNETESDCVTLEIPVIWCPTYNTTGQVKSLTVVKTATVQAPVSGGATIAVPMTVSVTVGSPSTVTVLTTVNIDATANKPGQDYKILTAFNSIPANGVVTGTVATVTGY